MIGANGPSSRESPHVALRFPAAEAEWLRTEQIAARLEVLRAELIGMLGLPGTIGVGIQVDLTGVPPAVSPAGDRPQPLRATGAAAWDVDALERALVVLLLDEAYGPAPSRPALIVDGLLGALRARDDAVGGLHAPVAAALANGETLSLAEMMGRPQPLPPWSRQTQGAASFIAFLLYTHGAERFRQLAVMGADSNGCGAAVEAPLALLDAEWRRALARVHEGQLGIQALVCNGWRYIRPHWRTAVPAALTLLPSIAFIMLQPLVLASLVDRAILPGDARMATLLIGGLVGLLVLYVLGDLAHQYLIARLATLVGSDLRRALFEHLQRLSLGFFGHAKAGDLLARFTSSLDSVERAIGAEVPFAISYVVTIVVGAVILAVIEWRLALLCFALLPTVFIGPRLLGTRAERAGYDRQAAAAQLVSTVQEDLDGQVVIKAFGLQALVLRRFERELGHFRRRAVRVGFLSSAVSASMTASAYTLLVIAIGTGTFMAMAGVMSVGSLIAFTEILWWMSSSVQLLGGVVQPLHQAAGGLRRIREVLEERPHVEDAPDAMTLPPLAEELRFEHVSFSYTGADANLRDVSFCIRRGESVAFIGPSGCGKSTILSLLLRFYDPQRGSVCFDGHDARAVTQESLRRQMATVLQESFLFNTTIRENIRMGRVEATDGEIEEAARAAEIHELVTGLPDGYDTMVGERGGHLSGGQRQRVAIARAILRDPAILVLDEATSALDVATEAAINTTLQRLTHGRTVVTVTHRLSSVIEADRIFVLDQGRIAEQGRHAELLALDGAYHRLWQKQSRFVVSQDGAQAGVDPVWLRSVHLFEDVPEAVLTDIASRLVTESVAAGRTVLFEGDPGDKFYVLVRGSVEVVKRHEGRDSRLAVLQDGDFFGETALLQGIPRTATIRTLTPCTFLTLQRGQFLDLMSRAPELAQAVDEIQRRRLAAQAEVAAH